MTYSLLILISFYINHSCLILFVLDLDESEWDKTLVDELENVSTEELEAQINEILAGDTK